MNPRPMNSLLVALFLLFVPPSLAVAQQKSAWRSATPAELQTALPARAQVEKERIETEMRTASGIIDPRESSSSLQATLLMENILTTF